MSHRLQALTRPNLPADAVALRPSLARRLGLLPGEPLWLTNGDAPHRRELASRWYGENRLGPDGCLVSTETLARLGVPNGGYVFVASAKLPQPSFYFFSWTHDDADEEPMPEDVLVLLDVSGSMHGAPLRSAKRALSIFSQRRDERDRAVRAYDRLGLITFGGDGREGVSLTCPLAADNARAFLEAAGNAESGGATPIAEALEAALAALQEPYDAGGESNRRRVILLTDGHPYPPDPPALDAVVAEMARVDIRIATVGVGDQFDRELLTSLAARTEAPFLDVHRMRDLTDLLARLA